jgi:hypothetical protein
MRTSQGLFVAERQAPFASGGENVRPPSSTTHTNRTESISVARKIRDPEKEQHRIKGEFVARIYHQLHGIIAAVQNSSIYLAFAVVVRLRPSITEDDAGMAALEPDAPPECTHVQDSVGISLNRPFYDHRSFKFDRVLGMQATQVVKPSKIINDRTISVLLNVK